jgi:hypothetical protein
MNKQRRPLFGVNGEVCLKKEEKIKKERKKALTGSALLEMSEF